MRQHQLEVIRIRHQHQTAITTEGEAERATADLLLRLMVWAATTADNAPLPL